MLLKEYLLLNLGRITPDEARRWQAEMSARRSVDACRDLLAFWQPSGTDEAPAAGRLHGYAVFSPHRFLGEMAISELQDGLILSVQRAIGEFGLVATAQQEHLRYGEAVLASVSARLEGAVLQGEIRLELQALRTALQREVPPRQLANAIAYHVEQVFGYAQAALHPVAYEEQMRLRAGH